MGPRGRGTRPGGPCQIIDIKMHRAKESYTKEETLFKSEARQDELLNDPNLTKSYCYNAMSNDGLSATSYAHFFHKLYVIKA
ncbi:hypothetical protein TRIUR3_10922 [Triticum urartu]|uniref:Uncharacterized protein n=1 Tax=Triticum urartu TaxID=4572 RepID=M8A816_TRIUA|nr:hypothetical protein TRIUR3_10922 [Triticum urartu]